MGSRRGNGRLAPLPSGSGNEGKPPMPPSVTFARRTASGRYVRYSREDIDLSGEISSEYGQYTVDIPPTPDNQPMSDDEVDPKIARKVEEQYVSSSLFTGGYNSVTRAHILDKVTESNDDGAGAAEASVCHTNGCDGKIVKNERGEEILPCECNFKICRDCYMDALNGGKNCPGCKEPYKGGDSDDPLLKTAPLQLPLPAPAVAANNNSSMDNNPKLDRRLSLMKSSGANKSILLRSQTQDFDHNRWLFETNGTYGYGNAFWPTDTDESFNSESGERLTGSLHDLNDKAWKPLTRKTGIPPGILSPYRLLIVIRMAALVFFLTWRIRNPNTDAMWLWGMSIVCELWFAFSWLLDQLPKLCPVNRSTDLAVLKDKFEKPSAANPTAKSDLPGIDVFVSTADPEKEPPLVTANTILSILAADYPVEKLSCYVSDDGGALLTFEAMAEAATFAELWVPFCRKHNIQPRNPESYFTTKGDPTKNKLRPDFVKDRRRMKREYDEFKVRINGLPDSIRRRSDAYHAREEIKALKLQRANANAHSNSNLAKISNTNGPASNDAAPAGNAAADLKVPKATWMADATHWPGTWTIPTKDHSKADHAGIIQVMLKRPSDEPMLGSSEDDKMLDLSEVDIRLPMLVYVSREKRPGYDHNKKAGAMNALVRASAVMSNGPFILNLDCDHYIYNSQAPREAVCFMMDRGGDRICYVQFPQRFEGIDPNDRYANHNTVFFDVNMRALDGLQGPFYVGTGCMFRRLALYGFDPPRTKERRRCCGLLAPRRRPMSKIKPKDTDSETNGLRFATDDDNDDNMYRDGYDLDEQLQLLPKAFGNSSVLIDSIRVAEFQGRPLADHPSIKHGRPAGALIGAREPLDASTVAEAISVISCWYEDKTEWGKRVGWIYGSVTEDVVTGYRMHNRGWKSVYCVTKRDAFRGTAPINLTDRLHQVLRWATGSVEIFFSRNNAFLASRKMKVLQRIAYLNVGIYPFTSIFLIVYCFLPALSLFSGQFIVQTLSVAFLVYLLLITVTLSALAVLEVRWSGIELEEWWRNEQFWLIGGTSAHLAAVLQGLLKVIAGVEISFTLTTKSAADDEEHEFADLYVVKWTSLMIPPITIMMVNLIAIAVGVARTIYAENPEWSKLLGGVFFSLWVLAHLYPFAKGLMGRRGRTPTIVYVWSGLLAITISLLWVAINPSSGSQGIGGSGFQFP